MATWQILVLFIVGVVLALPAAMLVSAAGGWFVSWRRERCQSCGRRALRCVQFLRATIVIDDRRAPDHRSYSLCETCGAQCKLHRGSWSVAPAEEWAQHCADGR